MTRDNAAETVNLYGATPVGERLCSHVSMTIIGAQALMGCDATPPRDQSL